MVLKKHNICSLILAILMIISLFSGCGKKGNDQVEASNSKNAEDKLTITDLTGAKVKVPKNISRIADSWGAHNAVLAMLGAGDKIVANSLNSQVKPWLYKVTPQINNASSVFSFDTNNVNIEELAKTKPDIIFMNSGNKSISKVSDLGIPVVQITFKDFESMKKCITLTGDILGEEAKKRASRYTNYFDDKLKMVTDVTSKLEEGRKPRVLHLATLSPLTVDGKDSIINSWIEAAGGVNAAAEISGSKEVTMEQIIKWNPDVVIVSDTVGSKPTRTKAIEEILNNDTWMKISAVKNGKVYVNPDGAFSWDRYSAEEALQIQWAAKILHPELFSNINIQDETKWFYRTFFHYELSDDETERIIKGEPPAS